MKEILRDEIKAMVDVVVEPLRKDLKETQATLAKFQQDLKQAIVKNEDLEQYSRRACLRIAGIQESRNEDVTQIIMQLAQHVKAAISPHDIDRAYRVGKPKYVTSEDFPESEEEISDELNEPKISREILVKFTNTSARLRMLKGRAVLRTNKENTFINEDLTKKRRDLAFQCRKLKKDKHIQKTWVYNGNVFILDNDSNKVRITALEDLDPYKPPTPRLGAGQPAGQ